MEIEDATARPKSNPTQNTSATVLNPRKHPEPPYREFNTNSSSISTHAFHFLTNVTPVIKKVPPIIIRSLNLWTEALKAAKSKTIKLH